MRIILVVIALLFSLASAKFEVFTAQFQAVAPQWGTGYFSGTLHYNWKTGFMQLIFDNADGYTEFYQFNTDKGYNPKVQTGQFTYQYLYKSSNSCPCETSALQFAMPALFDTAPSSAATATGISYWVNPISPPKDNANYKGSSPATVTQYFANPLFNIIFPDNSQRGYFLSNNFFQNQDQSPAGFAINDIQQRTFTLTSIQESTPESTGLKPPTTGCKCGKMLDIVMSMDRSGSIQLWQWALEHAFLANVSNSFEYGPLKTNMGIVNWNAAQWVTLDILSGTSLPTVQSAVSSMKCCPDKNGNLPTASSASCCCCGTPIGGGLWEAGYMLSSSTRAKATKVIIVLTDGCQNHIWGVGPNKDTPAKIGDPGTWATSCGCATEKACATNTNCTGDITYWYKWVVRAIPTVKIIAVGVGDQNTICTDQLMLAAGNDITNVYNPQSWDELQTIVQTITATACTTNETLCSDCCGICSCGVCYPAKLCYDKDKCNTGQLDPATGCCSTVPVTCTAGPCKISSCDGKLGCQETDVTCRPKDACIEWYCNDTSIVCTSKLIEPIPQVCQNITTPPQCVEPKDCDDQSNCTIDDCVGGKCQRTNVVCTPSNACNKTQCYRDQGCVTTTKNCNDNNACTMDSCDATNGCQHTNITCEKSTDPCFKVICDKVLGCNTIPIDYEKDCNLTAANCTVPACNGSCYEQYICFTPPPTGEESFPTTVVLSSALGGAAVAGIIIGAAVLVAGVGGGAAAAIAGAAGAGAVVTVSSNPVYKAAGTAGVNPLHKT